MPRHARKMSKSDIYHIMLRGINRQDLFHDDEDMDRMLSVLDICIEITKIRIHAYCLMSNHIHLLAQTTEEPESETLAQSMKRIGIRYAQYYNRKYERIGTLFQDRYKSEAVETDAYFITVLRYIHRNPVKAGIVKSPSEYKWSSYGGYAFGNGFTFTDMGMALLGDRFAAYMEEDDGAVCIDMEEAVKGLTDMELSAKIEEMLHIPAPIIASLDREERNKAIRKIAALEGVAYRQISRAIGIPITAISRAVNN